MTRRGGLRQGAPAAPEPGGDPRTARHDLQSADPPWRRVCRGRNFFAFGAARVDVPVVLPGFLMFVSPCGRRETAGRFLLLPAAHVVPVCWLVTLSLALIAMTGLRPIVIAEPRAECPLLFLPFPRSGYIEPLADTVTP